MENICILTDFLTDSKKNYYNELNLTTVPEKYMLHTGGNFIFISNDRNRTVRFNLKGMEIENISDSDFIEWLKRIQTLYPGF